VRGVLGQSPEAYFHIAELPFDHPERVFNLGPNLRFGLLDLVPDLVQDAALAQLLVGATPGRDLPDDLSLCMFGTFLYPGVARIGTDHVLLAAQQVVDLGDIGHVGRRTYDAMHQAGLGIGADMSLHAEVVVVALLRLVHLWITLAVAVLGRTRCVDDDGIDNRALAQRESALAQVAIDYCQSSHRQTVLLQQVAEIHDRRVFRDAALGQRQLGELAQRGDLVQRFLHRRVAEGEPVLQQVDAQHGVQRIRWTAIASLGVERLDQCQQPNPGHHLFYFRQKALAPGLFAFAGVLGIGKAHLGHIAGLSFSVEPFQQIDGDLSGVSLGISRSAI